jgi:hypothetical protein
MSSHNYKLIKSTASLTAATLGIVGLHYNPFINPALCCINLYAFVDLLFVNNDMALHHILVLLLSSTWPTTLKYSIIHHFLRLEYSTLFLSSRPLVMHHLSSRQNTVKLVPTIDIVFKIAFAGTFVKYRIYDFAMNVILNNDLYSYSHYQGDFHFIYSILVLWTFYALNLYWFQLIILSITKKSIE